MNRAPNVGLPERVETCPIGELWLSGFAAPEYTNVVDWWQSGLLHLSYKQSTSFGVRGFESLPLRSTYCASGPLHGVWSESERLEPRILDVRRATSRKRSQRPAIACHSAPTCVHLMCFARAE